MSEDTASDLSRSRAPVDTRPGAPEPLIVVDNLTAGYGETVILD